MTGYGYTAVPGSDALRTRPVGEGAAGELDSLDPAAPGGRRVAGEWLARTVVRDRYVPVLLEVFDRLALDQEPEEQAVYGHLWRLSLAAERNWCRVSRKELSTRTRMSDRRLGKALAGLVAKGHLRLVDRDRRGTLYRVLLPHEVFGEPDLDAVHVARPKDRPTASQGEPKPQSRPARPRPRRIPLKNDTLLDSGSMGALAASFLARHPERPGRTRADLVEVILDRLEEGLALPAIAAELEAFARDAPSSTPLAELPRFVARIGGG